jgi:hypothetical protein
MTHMLLVEAAHLGQKHPLSFLAFGAAATLASPVVAVVTAGALRPWARRGLSSGATIRRGAERIAAERRESHADLLAEATPPRESDERATPGRLAPAPHETEVPRSRGFTAEAA